MSQASSIISAVSKSKSKDKEGSTAENHSIFTIITTCFSYIVLFCFGALRDAFGRITGFTRFRNELCVKEDDQALLLEPYGNAFYCRRLKLRIQDCWDRPISSAPCAYIDIKERKIGKDLKTMEMTGNKIRALNLGSYNYLGFADNWNELCGESVLAAVEKYGISCQTSAVEYGYSEIHRELERRISRFLSKEDTIIYNMGYSTNLLTIPALAGPGALILSDSLNHASIVNGCRCTGAVVRSFRHNDLEELTRLIKEAIVSGQPVARNEPLKQWTKILVMVEGIYSMEGEICDLKGIVQIVKKYKCYLYVDEAHSIGALGETGRGVTEYCGVSPDDVDILMGTFTKSYGAMGGYISASKEIVDYIRSCSQGAIYSNCMSPVVTQQVITAMKILSGEDGTDVGICKLNSIRENAIFFRSQLKYMGCTVLGDMDSPVIPVMLFHPSKIAAFSRECLARGIAVVVVGAPAVPVLTARIRFVVSAAHDRNDLKKALRTIREVSKILNIRYERSMFG